jgi:hypothetical protein
MSSAIKGLTAGEGVEGIGASSRESICASVCHVDSLKSPDMEVIMAPELDKPSKSGLLPWRANC